MVFSIYPSPCLSRELFCFPDFDTKASDAVDFSDITEMAEEEEEKNRIQAAMSGMHPLERSTVFFLLRASPTI